MAKPLCLFAAGLALCTPLSGGIEIAGSNSYVLPGAPARTTDLFVPLALARSGTAFAARLEGTGEHVLLIRRADELSVVRASSLGLPAMGTSPFLRLASHGDEVLFAASHPASPAGVALFRADAGGAVLLVNDPVAAARQFRNGWGIAEWVARDGVFAMISFYSVGRVGFGTISSALSVFRDGTMTPVDVSAAGGPAFASVGQLALGPQGTRITFRGSFGSTGAPGKLNTFHAGIYAWENGSLRTLLDPETRFAGERVSPASFAITDDEMIAFFDSRRNAIALFSENRLIELVPRGARAADGTAIDLEHPHAVPRVLRIDARHVYFTGARRVMNPWGEEGVRDDLIFRVPRAGGPAEVFFDPARVFADATRLTIGDLQLTGDAPQLTFRAREIWGTQQAIYRATPPFGRAPFPAVPAGYPSVVLAAGWPDGFYHRAGEAAAVEAQVQGDGPFAFEWFANGGRLPAAPDAPVRAAGGTLTLFPFAQTYHTGDYTLAVTNAAGTSVVTAPVFVGAGSVADGGTPPALVNYSVRGYSTASEGIFTAGLSLVPPIELSYPQGARVLTTVAGTTQRLLVRAIGPGLAPFARQDVVPPPATRLELFRGDQLIARNDGAWSTHPAIAATSASVGAFPLAPGSRDSALVATLPPQSYTAQAAAPAGDGTILIECYVVQGRGHLRNISARGIVAETEPRSLTLGFVIDGPGARPVLLRGIGPGVRSFGVNGAASRPRLELFSGRGDLLARNSGHDTAPNGETIAEAGRQFGAFPLDSGDAALLLHLPAGVYVARVAAVSGSQPGVALIEFYTNVGHDAAFPRL